MRSGAPVAGLRIGILLASSSVAALLIGGGARPAVAACANVVGPGAVASFTNSGATACVTFSGATVSGNIVNAGTISNLPAGAHGILFTSAAGSVANTIQGSVSNSGVISVGGNGIFVNGAQTLLGGITNSGTIIAGAANDAGIKLFQTTTFAGGIVNASTGIITHADTGILVAAESTFSGGVTNAGTITGNFNGIRVGSLGGSPATFIGNISNSGTITDLGSTGAGPGNGGINVVAGSGGVTHIITFSGNIMNSGSISAAGSSSPGIRVANVTSFLGGISNGGTITAKSNVGILITATGGVPGAGQTFSGGVVNSGSISAGTFGIKVSDITNFSGGISSGSITAGSTGIRVTFASTFAGGITSSGILSAGKSGIFVDLFSQFSGDIVNRGTITPGSGFNGINVTLGGPPDTFTGNITNGGTISASGNAGEAVFVGGSGTFNGGLVNSGTLSAATSATLKGVIELDDVGVFGTGGLGIVNASTGTISNAGAAGNPFGILIRDVTTFLGGISNAGIISSPAGIAIEIRETTAGETFSGGITNSGTISGNIGVDVNGTFLGHIVNTGNITGSGGSALNLSSLNAVTIDQESGTINGAIDLSSHGDTVNISGGVINGNIVGQNAGEIINFSLGAGNTFTYGAAFGFTNVSTVNINSGTVVLNGANVATNVNVFGTLAGTGSIDPTTVTLESGGTLSPGTSAAPLGTFGITGTLVFNAGSFYAITIAPGGSNSKTAVTGSATLGGNGTVVVTPQIGHYNAGQIYQILTTTTGLTGHFAGLTVNGGFTGAMALDYTTNPGNVDLDITTGGAFLLTAPSGLNQNQQNVLNGLNNAILNNDTLPPGLTNLGNISGTSLLNALTALSGEEATGAQKGAYQLMTDFLNLMLDPTAGGGGNVNGGGANSFAPEQDTSLPADVALAYAKALKAPQSGVPQSFDQRWTAWGSAFGGRSWTKGDPVVGSNNVNASDFGSAAGMDYHATPNLIYGFGLSGGGTNWNLAQGLGSGRSDSFQAGVYAKSHWGSGYVSAALAFANHWFTTDRIALGDQLRATFTGQSYAARLEGGYRYAVPITGAIVGVTPYAALQAQDFHTPSYSETDLTGSGFGLSYASMNATDTRSELGARFDNLQVVNGMPLVLRGRLAWAHDWVSNPALGAVFEVLTGSNFTVNGAAAPKNSALTTAAAELHISSNWTAIAKFDGDFGSGSQTYGGTGTLKYSW